MPKENISKVEINNGPLNKFIRVLSVGWAKPKPELEPGWVAAGFVTIRFSEESAHDSDVLDISLTKDEVTHMIAILKKAKRQVFK